MSKFVDLTGKKFGKFTVLKVGSIREYPYSKGIRRRRYWICQCSCGNIREVLGEALKRGKSKSCGCYRKIKMQDRCGIKNPTYKHGKRCRDYKYKYLFDTWRTHLYHILSPNTNQRCYRNMPIDTDWDERLLGIQAYENFEKYVLEKLGEKPEKTYSIDIINHVKGFVKGNLRWADKKTQHKNRRFLLAMSQSEILSLFSDEDLIKELEKRKFNEADKRSTNQPGIKVSGRFSRKSHRNGESQEIS